MLHSILDFPTRPPVKSFCCLGIIQACHVRPMKKRRDSHFVHCIRTCEGLTRLRTCVLVQGKQQGTCYMLAVALQACGSACKACRYRSVRVLPASKALCEYFAFIALAMAMIGSDTESSSECLEEELSDAELWTVLLANFRAACGDSAEQLPPCKILAYLFDADADLSQLLDDFVTDSRSKAACVTAFRTLRGRALPQARSLPKRCAIVPAERPLLDLLQKKSRVVPPAMTVPTREWLRKKPGAIRRNRMWPSRRQRSLLTPRPTCCVATSSNKNLLVGVASL